MTFSNDAIILDANGDKVSSIDGLFVTETAQHIVDCVNACEGIEDPSRQIKNMAFEWLSTKTENERLQDQLRQIESIVSTLLAQFRQNGLLSQEADQAFWSKFNAITGTNAGGGQS